MNTFKKILRTVVGAWLGTIIASGWVLYESVLRNILLKGNMDTSWNALAINAFFGLIMGCVLINLVDIKINLK